MSIPQVGSLNLGNQATGGARTEKANSPPAELAAGAGAGPPLARASAQAHASAPQEPAPKAGAEQVTQAVNQLNKAMRSSNTALEFSIDKDTDIAVVRLTDKETGEVVMQFPSEESLALAQDIGEMQRVKLLSQKA